MPEDIEDLLRSLWREHAGTDPAPFLRFATAMDKEGDFLEFFREGWRDELKKMREGVA